MRSASVMPPLFDRSGCQICTAPASSSWANSKRPKWFSPAAIGTSGVIAAAARYEAKSLQANGSSSQPARMSASTGITRRTSAIV